MNIKMISPRTIFNREPFGKSLLKKQSQNDENYSENLNSNEFWLVRIIGNQQYELYVKDTVAVLHNFTSQDNCHLFTGFTETAIRVAVFACLSTRATTNASIESIFEELSESSPKGFVLFTEKIAKYYGFNAEIHSCKLPCRISSAHKFRNTIFIEREPSICPTDTSYSPHSLFVMTHTLAEFTPVVFKDELGKPGFVNDTRFRIVSICEVSFLLLAYDHLEETFSLWKIRDAVRDDFSDLYETHWDGSITIKREKLQTSSFGVRSTSDVKCHSQTDCSHVSSEYFEINVETANSARSLDDLDLRSPLARSMRNVKNSQVPDKMSLLHDINVSNRLCHMQNIKVEPLYPKVCLVFLCQFKSMSSNLIFDANQLCRQSTPSVNGGRKIISNHLSEDKKIVSVSGFFAEDFYRRKYICCMRNSADNKHNLLQIVPFNYDNKTAHFCSSNLDEYTYPILDAVYLDQLKLIIVLEISSTLSIYAGVTFVCKISLLNSLIYEPDLLFEEPGVEISTHDINSMTRLSEPTGNGFTIHTESGHSLRLYLSEMVRFHLVKKCLIVLKKMLPVDVGMKLLCRWYSLNRAVDNNEPTSVEWKRFVEFLLDNLGFIKNKHQENSIIRDVKGLCINHQMDFQEQSSGTDGDVSMEEICPKKLRTSVELHSIMSRYSNRDRLSDYCGLTHNVSDRLLSRYAPTVLLSLHLVYESEKASHFSSLYLTSLVTLSCSLAYSIEASRYIDYYITDYPDLWSQINRLPSLVPFISTDKSDLSIWTNDPPNWNKWLINQINPDTRFSNNDCAQYPIIEDLNEIILHLIKIWLVMFHNDKLLETKSNFKKEFNRHLYRINFDLQGKPCRFPIRVPEDIYTSLDNGIMSIGNIYERTACYLRQIDFQLVDLDYLKSGLAAVFKLTFLHCNKYPHLYSVLGRSDLDKQRQLVLPIIKESEIPEIMSSPLQKFRTISQSRLNCYSYWTNNVKPSINVRKISDLTQTASVNHYLLAILDTDPTIQLCYPDMRIHEAYKMLQSCCPIELDVSICNNFTAEDGDTVSSTLKEELDGYLKIISCQRTFALPIGRGMIGLQVVQSNWLGEKLPVPPLCLTGKFSLSESGKPQSIEYIPSTKQWPYFHNGVATGLMVSSMNDAADVVWILKQCPSIHLDKIELTPEQAGILLGLGLNGHLNKLSHDTIGQTIKSMNEMATMAILIGLSAFNLGSKNSTLSKHISFHYRRLIPGEKDHTDPIPTLCQVAAIISAGLLNFKSGDRKMAKLFIEEMGRSREHLSVDGSPPSDIELTSVTAGFTVGLIMFQQGDVFCREYNPEELTRLMSYLKGLHRFQSKDNAANFGDIQTDLHIKTILKNHDVKKPQPISDVDNWSTFQTKNPRVQEGEYYNMDITGPGAAIALGLIFMDSLNEIIARQLECPETFYLLEQIRSPVLCFRQIAYGLIMWRTIVPSQEWVESTIPEFVSSKAFVVKPTGVAEKYLETANESYLQMLVGSCFVMGLRYAGTDDNRARETIVNYIEKLLYVKNNLDLMQYISRNQYDWAVSTLFLSACMITAGSGNLQLLRMSRYLRSIHHPKDTCNYGVNMAYSMSIGLLFLGGGKLTLSNSPRSAAMLLIAFFPRFPPTYSGRRYHLQSLRHLYVIATRPRVLCAVDLDTQTAVPFDSRIKLKKEIREYHGCMVYPPENPRLIEEIEFFDKEGKYWPQVYKPFTEPWNILFESMQSGGYFFVKKKTAETGLKDFVDKFRIERAVSGHEITDHALFVNFVDKTHDLMTANELPFNVLKILTRVLEFSMTNKSNLKLFFNKLLSVDIDEFGELISLYDWCQLNDVLKVWSVFSSYFQLTLQSLKSILLNIYDDSTVMDHLKLLIREILM